MIEILLALVAYRATIYGVKKLPESKVKDGLLVVLVGPHPTTPV
jgi:hypothetical protein